MKLVTITFKKDTYPVTEENKNEFTSLLKFLQLNKDVTFVWDDKLISVQCTTEEEFNSKQLRMIKQLKRPAGLVSANCLSKIE